jgi:hypothetical protein
LAGIESGDPDVIAAAIPHGAAFHFRTVVLEL